jgi:hypothetical protein
MNKHIVISNQSAKALLLKHFNSLFLTSLLTCSISTTVHAQTIKKNDGVNLVGRNFPTLFKTLEAPSKTSKPVSPCTLAKALRVAELEKEWKLLIASISLTCEVGKGIEDEPDANTTATAKLKPKAANFGGVPIIEIRMSDSAWGNDYQYVLNARFANIKKQLKSVIRKNCIKEITVPITDDICRIENDGQHGGLYLDTGEGGGIWLHADPDNPNQTIYASAWSE